MEVDDPERRKNAFFREAMALPRLKMALVNRTMPEGFLGEARFSYQSASGWKLASAGERMKISQSLCLILVLLCMGGVRPFPDTASGETSRQILPAGAQPLLILAKEENSRSPSTLPLCWALPAQSRPRSLTRLYFRGDCGSFPAPARPYIPFFSRAPPLRTLAA